MEMGGEIFNNLHRGRAYYSVPKIESSRERIVHIAHIVNLQGST